MEHIVRDSLAMQHQLELLRESEERRRAARLGRPYRPGMRLSALLIGVSEALIRGWTGTRSTAGDQHTQVAALPGRRLPAACAAHALALAHGPAQGTAACPGRTTHPCRSL